MRGKRSRLALVGILTVVIAAIPTGIADAKKKKTGAKTATVTKAVNALVPDRLAAAPSTFGQLDTILTIGKKFKGRTVAADSVTVTFNTIGAAAGASNDLRFFLINPKGRTVLLTEDVGGTTNLNIGPVTVTPNSPVGFCNALPCSDPMLTLGPPFVGTVGASGLALFTGTGVRGNWIFRVQDASSAAGQTSTLGTVKLQVGTATG